MKSGGIKAFYRGWISTLIRDIPFSCVYFPLYANLKELNPLGGGSWWNFTCGLLSGSLAGLSVTPMDVIKTRLQSSNAKGKEKIGFLQCTKNTYNEEGFKAFFKGGIPRMICIGAIFAVAQLVYEIQVGNKLLTKFNA